MNRERETLSILQYLLDEGFISFGYRDGEPSVFLTTSLEEAQRIIKARGDKDSADWWKK